MKHKKYIAIALTALLTFGSAQTALAKVIYHDISEGNLEISQTTDDTYEVTGSTTTYSIIVKDRVVTHIVLNGVNIETTNENGIKIGSEANVVLELDGTNSITVNTESYDRAKAGINVAEGTLTITGGEDDSLDVKVIDNGYLPYYADGAAIGSDEDEDFTGTIIIEGGNITAVSEYGAGIGSGYNSEMSGTITISGGEVTASSGYYGAGIGAGDFGDITESGSITIGGDADVTVSSYEGLGIGSGDYGNMNGTITITDDAKVDITLGYTLNKTGIGAGERSDDVFNGSINILEHANVELKYDDPDYPDYKGTPNIGSANPDSTGEITLSTGATINGVSGSDSEALKGLGIIYETSNVSIVEPTPETVDSRNTYSLKQLNLVQRINEAEDGEVVAVSEKQLSKGKLPAYVLEALAQKENVTLAILCEKFDILIPSDEAVKDAGSTQFYTIDELVEMYE